MGPISGIAFNRQAYSSLRDYAELDPECIFAGLHDIIQPTCSASLLNLLFVEYSNYIAYVCILKINRDVFG